MAWLEITLSTAPDTVDDAAARLTAAGFSELVIEDQAQFSQFLEQNRAYWDYIDEALQTHLQGLSRIRLYLEDSDSEGLARLRALAAEMELPMTAAPRADTDWPDSLKVNLPTVAVGQRLRAAPCWLADTDTGGRLPVILDPGLTFGTGTHPSTQMVMEALEQFVTPGCHCLDLGSGSGILSIAALRLGAADAVGVDIDPKAEDMARENGAYNGFFPPRFTACTGNVNTDTALMASLSRRGFDLVLVNIVADVIIGLAPVLPGLLGEGSCLICSGILDSRLDDVLDALGKAGLTVTGVRAKEDWRCVTAERSVP